MTVDFDFKVPEGWDFLTLQRSTPHGVFDITRYADGDVHVLLFPHGGGDGIVIGTGKPYPTLAAAIEACELELLARNHWRPALCGPENVDADGRQVAP